MHLYHIDTVGVALDRHFLQVKVGVPLMRLPERVGF